MPKIDATKNLELLTRIAPDVRPYLKPAAASVEPPQAPADPKGPVPRVSLGLPPTREDGESPSNYFYEDVLATADKAGIGLAETRLDASAYFLVLLGIPGQADIDALLATTDPRWLIVIAVDPAEVSASLTYVDWVGLHERLRGAGGGLALGCQPEPKLAAILLRHTVRALNPVGIDGLACWPARNDAPTLSVLDEIRKELMLGSLYFDYLGDFFDESVMLRAAHENIVRHGGRLYARKDIPEIKGVPVIVIATGPSLDPEFGNLRRLQDRVILVSSGSSVQPLIAQGVYPDIHVECENINIDAIFQHIHDKDALKRALAVTSATGDPTIRHELGDVVLFFRHNHSAYPLFADVPENALLTPEPSVLNASVSFVQEIGATDIRFVGTDFGKKADIDHHHSLHSYYYIDGTLQDEDLDFSVPAKGVDGDTILATRFLYLVREHLEEAVRLHSEGRTYTNHSHGARIRGTAEALLADFDPPPLAKPKAEIMAAVRAAFAPVDDARKSRWREKEMTDAIDAFVAKLKDAIQQSVDAPANVRMDRLLAVLGRSLDLRQLAGKGAADAVRVLFRGTSYLLLILLETMAARVTRPEEFRRMAYDLFCRQLDDLAVYARTAIADPYPPYVAPKRRDDALRADMRTVRRLRARISRLSPCPCGSGQPYKRCHGRPA